ncbi:hypothetical protein Lalb_Chr25g0283321 [Lupinus albus]|uniref:Uncharacterized protein n=1 Tax=Lupinus albus TaxID=3870 RepID=A0A6A4N7M8_LUPAL|nr:hypothetical protein Lalb_Chr25g0283321 [Lupinus albus]
MHVVWVLECSSSVRFVRLSLDMPGEIHENVIWRSSQYMTMEGAINNRGLLLACRVAW